MRTEIRRLHDELRATMVYVTHSSGDAAAMADRVAIMRAGRIVQIGTVKELRENPVESYVTELLTSS